MSQSICTIPAETKQTIRKFRLQTIKQSTTIIPVQIYKIDNKTGELSHEETLDLQDLEELNDELPDNTPRFIMVNYHYTNKDDNRFINPLIGIYWRPKTSKNEIKMMYASCIELFKFEINCNLWFECTDEDEIIDLKDEIEK